MRAAQNKDLEPIKQYLRKGVFDCLYMYIDIAKYGLDYPWLKVWINDDTQDIHTVVMKYYDSISVYTAESDWNYEEVLQILDTEHVSTVNGRKDIMEVVVRERPQEYLAEYGYVFKFRDLPEMTCEDPIRRADEQDMQEAAALICADAEFGAMYKPDVLAQQLAERIRSHMGRSYVIEKDHKMIAHIASYAEFEGLSTTSGLVVDKEYQNGLYGAVMESYLIHRLREDGFDVYTFVTKRLRKILLERQGHECIGEYGKLVRK